MDKDGRLTKHHGLPSLVQYSMLKCWNECIYHKVHAVHMCIL